MNDEQDHPVITVGAKVRNPNWEDGRHHLEVTAVGRQFLLAVSPSGVEWTLPISDDWVRYVEPPTVVSVSNVYRGGAIRWSNRTGADERALPDRIAVVTVYSDGSVTVEDVRP